MFFDIEQLADQLAGLTIAEAVELGRYIEECDGLGGGVLVGCGSGPPELDAFAVAGNSSDQS